MLHIDRCRPFREQWQMRSKTAELLEELQDILLHQEFGGTMWQMMISCALCGSIFALTFELISGFERQYRSALEFDLFDFRRSTTNHTMLVATSHLMAI
jgi:hypothetical protein